MSHRDEDDLDLKPAARPVPVDTDQWGLPGEQANDDVIDVEQPVYDENYFEEEYEDSKLPALENMGRGGDVIDLLPVPVDTDQSGLPGEQENDDVIDVEQPVYDENYLEEEDEDSKMPALENMGHGGDVIDLDQPGYDDDGPYEQDSKIPAVGLPKLKDPPAYLPPVDHGNEMQMNDKDQVMKVKAASSDAPSKAGAMAVNTSDCGGLHDEEEVLLQRKIAAFGTSAREKFQPDYNPINPTEDGETFQDENPGIKRENGIQKTKSGLKREMNPTFKDVKETGKWGRISRVEMLIVALVTLGIIIGVIVAIVYVVVLKDGRSQTKNIAADTAPPTMAPTSIPPQQRFANLKVDIGRNNATMDVLEKLTNDTAYYSDKGADTAGNCNAEPDICAMHWYLYADNSPPVDDDIASRFALATMYYAMGGSEWVNNTNWLTEASYCAWYGITCSRVGSTLEELDLSENNLKGEIPEELVLLQSMQILSLKQNEVSGALPGDVFAALPQLFAVYLQYNKLTGTIPSNLRGNGVLSVLFIHGNNFTGDYPLVYCPNGSPAFRQFALDCTKNSCPNGCCSSLNCF